MANYDSMKLAIEMLTGGKNTVIFDDMGLPSVMVVIPKMNNSALITGAASATHPAFIVNNVEKDRAYFSKYINIVKGNRAYSLPMQDPKTSINIDAARTACRAKGAGWSLTPAALWSAVALLCKKSGFMPHGNNDYGKDKNYGYEVGIGTSVDNGKTGRTATGSGPATWFHDGTYDGIADMNGDVLEWQDGARYNSGEINIVKDADCMLATSDMSASSALWKAILQDGSLVAPGSENTLKYSNGVLQTAAASANTDKDFDALTAASGITVPDILKALTLFPADASGYEGDHFWVNIDGERVLRRGGSWSSGVGAGLFSSSGGGTRSNANGNLGFRAAYYEL